MSSYKHLLFSTAKNLFFAQINCDHFVFSAKALCAQKKAAPRASVRNPGFLIPLWVNKVLCITTCKRILKILLLDQVKK